MKEWFEQGDWSEFTEHAYAPLPADFPVDWLREQVEREERILRMQYPEGKLPPQDEMELSKRPKDSPAALFHRRMYIAHLYLKRSQNLEAGSPERDEHAQEVMRQLVRREPVVVELDSRTVEVTGRSYAAMMEIARHWLRLVDLEADLGRAQKLEDELIDDDGTGSEARLKTVTRIHRRLLQERRLHLQAIYAHLFTESGAPAESLEDAPDWWEELGPAEDARLLFAAWEAGPGRLQRLGDPPQRDRDDHDDEEDHHEDYGWHSLFTTIEREQELEPASLYDRDLFQLQGWLRSSRPPRVL